MENIVTNHDQWPSAQLVAQRMLDEGLCPIPVKFKSKKPTVGNWQKLTRESVLAQYDKLFPEGQPLNVGCLLGKPSGNVTDLDFDWPEASALARFFLPPTRVFGRQSSRSSHWLYRVDETPTVCKFRPPEKPSTQRKPDILEVRGNGHQTVWPSSVHESGEAIEWENDVPITEISYGKLHAAIQQLAAATWLCTVWGKGNSRDELANALAGGMLRDGNDVEAVKHFLEAVMTQCEDEEIADRIGKVGRSDKIINGGREGLNFGWPKVAELLGQKPADWLRNLLKPVLAANQSDIDPHTDVAARLAEFNTKHAIIRIGGRVWVMNEEEPHPVTGHLDVTFSSTADLKTLYANRPIQTMNNGRVSLVNPVGIWLISPDRREYKNLVFDPARTAVPGYYNLWRGWPVKPEPGDCSLFLKHVRDNIAGGNEEYFRWIEGWMAQAIQDPSNRPGTAIVLRGGQGTGKGTFATWFGRLFGQHFKQVNNPRHLVGHFNAHLKDVLLLFADEAFWAGDKGAEGVLKGLITEKMTMIEQKGKDAIEVRNCLRLVSATNHEWAMPSGLDERRFAIFDVSDACKQNRQYFAAITHQMTNGGLAALMDHLLSVDLSSVDVAAIPKTKALEDNKLYSADSLVRWVYDQLRNGVQLPDKNEWQQLARVPDLFEAFKAATEGDRRYSPARAHEGEFAKAYKKLLPGVVRVKVKSHASNKRTWAWRFPPFEVCVQDFEAATGLTIRSDSIDEEVQIDEPY